MEKIMPHAEREVYVSDISYSNVLLIPGLPNKGINAGITEFFTKNHSNLIFVNDNSFGVNLEENTEKILNQIHNGEIEGINKNLPVFLVGLSFGGGIALKYIKNSKIKKIIALSPLFNETGKNVDFEGLFQYIQNISGNSLNESIEDFKYRIETSLQIHEKDLKNFQKYTIISIDTDPEIQIPEKYNPIVLQSSDLGILHFGLRKTGDLSIEHKKKIFSDILNFNNSVKIKNFGNKNIFL